MVNRTTARARTGQRRWYRQCAMIRLIASLRVAASRSWPRTAEVMVFAPGLRMPRIDMHMCSHSTTTITPRGSRISHQRVGDLRGQPLLDLGAAGVDVDQPGQLGQAGDLAGVGRDVADVRDAAERDQVVLAGRVDLDVLDQHHLVVAEVEGRRQDVLGPLPQPGEDLLVRTGHPGRRLPQSLAVRVLADRDQQLAHGVLGPLLVELADRALAVQRHRVGHRCLAPWTTRSVQKSVAAENAASPRLEPGGRGVHSGVPVTDGSAGSARSALRPVLRNCLGWRRPTRWRRPLRRCGRRRWSARAPGARAPAAGSTAYAGRNRSTRDGPGA